MNFPSTPVTIRSSDSSEHTVTPGSEGGADDELIFRLGGLTLRHADCNTIEGGSRSSTPAPSSPPGSRSRSVSSVPPLASLDRPQSKKVFIFQCGGEQHDTGGNHQENELRTELICGEDGCLKRGILGDFLVWVPPEYVQPSSMADLLRVHEGEYLRHVEKKIKGEKMPRGYAPHGQLDTDTPLSPQSFDAARRFCGAAMMAVDAVFSDWDPNIAPPSTPATTTATATATAATLSSSTPRRAFAIGRPPGHHAGPSGCVISDYFWHRPDMASSGFCLLNTVGVAAAYAMYRYGRQQRDKATLSALTAGLAGAGAGAGGAGGGEATRAPRICIIDIDVHHGNGTEEIIRNTVPNETFLPLPSSWAPVSRFSHKPWLTEDDSDSIMFGSINLVAADRFYPCTGSDSDSGRPRARAETKTAIAAAGGATGGATSDIDGRTPRIINIGLTPVGPGPWDLKSRTNLSSKQRTELCRVAGLELRQKVSENLLPAVRAFQPDLLIISSGFDAHHNDMYHFLTEEDFHWITEELCACASWGVVSVLEGGYSLSSPVPQPKTKVNVPPRSSAKRGKEKGSGLGPTTEGSGFSPDVSFSTDPTPPLADRFQVLPGDGGLVKGVLAHVAALAGRPDWAE
jgi:acetoin utilization deacetylase AcuC-like enzyme